MILISLAASLVTTAILPNPASLSSESSRLRNVRQSSAPTVVKVVRRGEKWELLRNGKPYWINGVGASGLTENRSALGKTLLEELAIAGGNSVRGWGAENGQRDLDIAQSKNMSMMLGIWLGHRSYFNYSDRIQVKKQEDEVLATVLKHKNHPALLIYGLGNEMEVDNNDTPELWMAIERLCQIVKKADPNHPTATVVADISTEKIQRINKYCPSLDILGVNSYGGLPTLPARLKAAGWNRPYIVTEFGPNGPWEMKKSEWGAAYEPTSTEKSAKFKSDYAKSILDQKGQCLGSYAFLWGWKQEETPTWFGMWLPTGERTSSVDVMQEYWTKKRPKNLAPVVKAGSIVNNGSEIEASVEATDPDGDRLNYVWEVRFEASEKRYAGEGERIPLVVESPVTKQNSAKVKFKAPSEKAAYRLYVRALDGNGNAGTANFVFKVK